MTVGVPSDLCERAKKNVTPGKHGYVFASSWSGTELDGCLKSWRRQLMWLHCDLQTFGKTLVRRGWKPGLPRGKPSVWVFCPLRRALFPRDRVLIEVCENCEHFSGHVEKSWTPKVKVQRRAKPSFSRLLELALKEKEKQDEEWRREERELFGDEPLEKLRRP